MTYSRPDSLSDALDLIARQHHQVVAGGTDIYAATTAPVLQGSVLDITAIQELRGISQTAEGWRIGGATTWTDIINEKLPAAFDGLKLCAREIGSRQIQNAATLAGNLCNASPAADGVPVLLTLEASVELCSQAATRTLPLADFLTGPRQTVLRDDELLSAIVVPETGARGRSGFIKLGSRKYLVISIVMAAVRLVENDGLIEDIAISVGSCSPVAVRLNDLETALIGQQIGSFQIAENLVNGPLSPIDDIRATADYRRSAAVEIVRRVIAQALEPGP